MTTPCYRQMTNGEIRSELRRVVRARPKLRLDAARNPGRSVLGWRIARWDLRPRRKPSAWRPGR